MPMPDHNDDPEGDGADALIARIRGVLLLTPPPPPAPPAVTLPAPPPGSRYALIGPAFRDLLTELCVLAHVPAARARRKINAALVADRRGPSRLAALAEQLAELPSFSWGSSGNPGRS